MSRDALLTLADELPSSVRGGSALSAAQAAWHVLYVKSRQEKALSIDADRLGIASYVPLIERKSLTNGCKTSVQVPLLPGYVFLYGTRAQAFQIDRIGRVVRIIPVVDQRKIHRELSNIQHALSNGAQLDPYRLLVAGLHVVVREGPFEGLEGVIESRAQSDRLILKVDILGQAVSMEIDGRLLEVMDSFAH